jgi:hypothetical protein
MQISSTINVKYMKTQLQIITLLVCLTATAARAESDFTFKGFSLGMSLDDAEKLINEKYNNAFDEVTNEEIGQAETQLFALVGYESKANYRISIASLGFPLAVVEADSQKKVIAFRFPSEVVDKLFNSGDMPARDFAKQFLHSYNLPELKPSSFPVRVGAEKIGGWEYTSPKGFRVRISVNKDLTVEAVPSSGERKFD